MAKKIAVWLLMVAGTLNLSGCVFLFVGGAAVVGGMGTAKWLSDKLVEEVNFPYDKAVQGAKDGLGDLHLDITKVVTTNAMTEIDSKYSDGRPVWVVVNHVSGQVSRLEVRVGVWGGQADAHKVLNAILAHL